jgi:hypothetical protein
MEADGCRAALMAYDAAVTEALLAQVQSDLARPKSGAKQR